MNNTEVKGQLPVITTSFLVMGNVLGVGVLALPIKCGLSGFVPALIAIVLVWAVMLISAWVIAYKINIEKSDSFDIPSFYGNSLGKAGKWVAIACNLILLYGVLVAYLGGISTMVSSMVKSSFPDLPISKSLITVVYFSILTTMILFGMEALRKGNMIVVAVIWISFFGLVLTGVSQFDAEKLAYTDWKLMVVGLPVAVSAFHFHNIIPTVSRALKHDVVACRKAIFVGVFLGLLINLIWVTVVMGTMAESGYGLSKDTIEEAYWHGLPATVPMADILKSRLFTMFAAVFAVFSVTASYMANGAGLFGFIRDMTVTYLKKDSRFSGGVHIFSAAVDGCPGLSRYLPGRSGCGGRCGGDDPFRNPAGVYSDPDGPVKEPHLDPCGLCHADHRQYCAGVCGGRQTGSYRPDSPRYECSVLSS